MARRNDVRVIKTRQKLRRALLLVLGEKRIEDLSITEVCSAAGVNRNTFYAHYSDLCELLDEVKSSYLEYFINELGEYRKKSTGTEDMLTYFLKLIDESRFFFSVIFSEDSFPVFMHSLVQISLEETFTSINCDNAESSDICIFVTGGVSNMIDSWLRSSGQITVEEEAGKIRALIDRISG